MLAVVVADVEMDGDFHFDRQKVGTTPADLRGLADWLIEQDVEEVFMESTALLSRTGGPARAAHAGAAVRCVPGVSDSGSTVGC